jgi:hypothetical protein
MWSDVAFRDGLMSNLLATTLGLIFGIPIALEISRLQQQTQDRNDRLARETEARHRKIKILSLIREELDINRQMLEHVLGKQEETLTYKIILGHKDEIWQALSDSSELKWIDDPDILRPISWAYYHIKGVKRLENEYSNPGFHYSISSTDGTTYAGERIVKQVIKIRPNTLTAICEALDTIDQQLAAINNF